MSTEYMSAGELQEALSKQNTKESRPASFIVALVKQADGGDYLLVSQTGCTDWIEIPTKMIAKTKFVGRARCGVEVYPVALIFLAPTDDLFGRVAYKLLEQFGTVSRRKNESEAGSRGHGSSGGCSCQGAGAQQTGVARAAVSGGGLGGLGQWGNIGGNCHFELQCYPCIRCIPWTNWCWESDCCDLVAVDCTIGF